MDRRNRGIRARAAAALLIVACMIFGAAVSAMADYKNVMDGRLYDNEYLVIKRDPTGKVGSVMSIPVTVCAPYDMEDVWVGLSPDTSSFYSMPKDGGEDAGLQNDFPFEINEDTFTPKRIGNLRDGSSKTVTLSARVRRDM